MKSLKMLVIVGMLFGGIISVTAQRKVVKIYPKHGVVVTKINKPKLIVHKGAKYHFAEGVWYRTRGRKYVVCAAPLGIAIRTLPRGNKVVKVNGRKLYKYKGIWYQKKGRGYIVVNV